MTHMTQDLMTPQELAQRWRISHRTLEYWRYEGIGPLFLKLGGKVLYRPEDIAAYEQQTLRKSTSEKSTGASL